MKKVIVLVLILFGIITISLESCGPVVVTSRLNVPPPHWFYPNRVETVRYVYFPDHLIYYDFSLRNYLYLNNGLWVSVNVLPSKFNHVNLRRSRQVRINNYFEDNIKKYHNENRNNLNRRSSTSRRRN